MITIGLNGIDFSNGNFGCEALAYSLINCIKEQCNKNNIQVKYIFFCFKYIEEKKKQLCENLNIEYENIEFVEITIKSLRNIKNTKKYYKKCDFVIDMSGGDSFSDIYGLKRMLRESFYKLMAINNKIPLVLGPQTYGPYNKIISKIIARKIMKNATLIFSRDKKSSDMVYDISKIRTIDTTDLAIRLPYKKEKKTKNKSIGINVSALMWNKGFNGKNQFELKVNYKKYINELVKSLKQKKEYEIYLISHVNASGIEDDYKLCKELAQKYNVCVAPKFKTAIEAKTFISTLNILIGSRMHATIAAFSTEVPTISLAYSKKFEGLYKSVNYNYYIDAKKINTDEALKLTDIYIGEIDKIITAEKESLALAIRKLSVFDENLEKIILECSKKKDN